MMEKDLAAEPAGPLGYVLRRYEDQIAYYWKASRANKRAYKWTRYLTVVLGALVTLASSLSAAGGAEGAWVVLKPLLTFGTPVLAAMLAILGGFSQNFQWGATWREMVTSAERLGLEYDRLRVLPPDQRDPKTELDTLNRLVLEETRGFFGRILGRSRSTPAPPTGPSAPP